jgi:apolipoprotein N-acyltransferase
LRLVIAAVSGAALSLSYTGFYLSIYSWICIGILLVALFGARPRVAFACGFLHGLVFCLTSVPWIATVLAVHGGVSRLGGWGVLLVRRYGEC